ncbi:MAG: two-component regulator propeller domain-containing protein [Bacteroidales bacterium]
MKITHRILLLVFCVFFPVTVQGQNIFRFDHIGSEDGLSQNTGFSILFDSKGFMWVGTYNGLNRYDGYEFKIFRSSTGDPASFTNNRVIKLWEDLKGFIWLETYDGYYHFFNPETETFHSIPSYEGDVKNGAMKVFLQYSKDKILLGSSESGLYLLKFDSLKNTYAIRHFTDTQDNSIVNNSIKFIHSDSLGNVWIGTERGISFISNMDIETESPVFKNKFINYSFTSVCETSNEIWFGSESSGIFIYDKSSEATKQINTLNTPEFKSDKITHLHCTGSGSVLAGFRDNGLMIYSGRWNQWRVVKFHSDNLDKIYEDRFGQLWLTALEFGLTRLDLRSFDSKQYVLTPKEKKPLTDLERPQFYEDSNNNMWIGLHGNGLGLYDRVNDSFKFYRNDPKDPNTISSNIVYCITQDRYGQLWIGTGQVLGGVEKVILGNDGFRHYLLEKERVDVLDNVSRAMIEDQNKYLWVATKAGKIHLFDSLLRQVRVFYSLPGIGLESFRNITYSFFKDSNGYLWAGSKGYGLSVSTQPLDYFSSDYSNIRFRRFEHSPTDSTSIGNNNIYSVCEDKSGNIWVGTYGNGISLLKDPLKKDITFTRINQQNSNLSSNLIRHLLIDSSGNLWVATTFGLNFLGRKYMEAGNFRFRVFLKNPSDPGSLIYNDIIHIYEDKNGRLWFGTFGGGVDLLDAFDGVDASFRHFGTQEGSGFGIIYGILGDTDGKIWVSTENGLVRINPENNNTEVFNSYNGLGFNSFSENTCCTKENGQLLFGGSLGFEAINPDNIIPSHAVRNIELTKFLLFNKEVSFDQKDSPLKKSISFSDNLSLKYYQSSFSIDFSALDFLDPDRIQYTYKLDNFEDNWNYIGNQHRATYTNLSPGKYIFRVKSLETNGQTASEERILNIRITPPWWKTRVAFFIYTILAGLTAVLIYNAITRINRYKNELVIEKRVNEVKLQFFTNISHEIRTPLTLIIGPLEDMIEEKSLAPVKKLQMEIMLKNARRMLHLTNQLLDFRKVQNNKMILKIREIDIVEFTKEIYNSFGPLARHKGITCEFESQFDSLKIYGDPNKLDIIIYNIISNAIKFTETGKKVQVRIEESDKDNSVDISITDEGPGIPQKNISDIFTRYTILSNQDLAGTGIGLSLSYELARLHRGEIVITSVVGKGSKFTIRLLKGNEHFLNVPGIETNDINLHQPGFTHNRFLSEEDETEGNPPITDSSEKNLVLVVEDNHEILNYICQSLKSSFTPIEARSGEEGLHLAKTMNPDLIITDIRMPGMDGMEMTRQLKADFTTSHIPIIMLTAKGELSDQIAGIEMGAEAYIVKPFSMQYLQTVGANLLNQRSRILSFYFNNQLTVMESLKITSKDGDFLSKIVHYIEENYTGDFSIDILAGQCNVSRTVLYNKIKGLTGFSPIEFTRRIKMNIGRKLLENGFNVSEAAYKTGFSDVKYFSRLFKAQFGHPPSRIKIEK